MDEKERSRALGVTLSQIEKQFGKGSILRLGSKDAIVPVAVISSGAISLDFALGAVMALRRAELEALGGFHALVEYLADDYQLGNRIAAHGKCIEICPVVVECREKPAEWIDVLQHQLRWARTIRVCQPAPYFLSILSNATFWPLLWLFIYPSTWAFIIGSGILLWRSLSAQILQNRLTGRAPSPFDTWAVLLKDILSVPVWAAAFLGDEVHWRGQTYRVVRGGKLINI